MREASARLGLVAALLSVLAPALRSRLPGNQRLSSSMPSMPWPLTIGGLTPEAPCYVTAPGGGYARSCSRVLLASVRSSLRWKTNWAPVLANFPSLVGAAMRIPLGRAATHKSERGTQARDG